MCEKPLISGQKVAGGEIVIIITLKAFSNAPTIDKIRILRKVAEGTAKIIDLGANL